MQQCTLLRNNQLHNKRNTEQVVPITVETNPNNFAAGQCSFIKNRDGVEKDNLETFDFDFFSPIFFELFSSVFITLFGLVCGLRSYFLSVGTSFFWRYASPYPLSRTESNLIFQFAIFNSRVTFSVRYFSILKQIFFKVAIVPT